MKRLPAKGLVEKSTQCRGENGKWKERWFQMCFLIFYCTSGFFKEISGKYSCKKWLILAPCCFSLDIVLYSRAT